MGWEFLNLWNNRPRRNPYPTSAFPITLTAADIDYSTNPLLQIYVGGAGDVYVQMLDENGTATWAKYVADKGLFITGVIMQVGGSTRGTTATELIGHR